MTFKQVGTQYQRPFIQGDNIRILDLGVESVYMNDSLDILVGKLCEHGDEHQWLGRHIYTEVVQDVVRLLNLPPWQAIEMCKQVPRTETFRDIIVLFHLREIDVLRTACHELALKIYTKLRKQLGPNISGAHYSSEIIGIDHVAIRVSTSLPLL